MRFRNKNLGENKTMKKDVTFRYADRKDTGLILKFIKELAEYEHMA